TYQALSGAGYPGVPSLDITANVIPFIEGEEEKMRREAKKILGSLSDGILPSPIDVWANCARVAVRDGHLEAVSIPLKDEIPAGEIAHLLSSFRGEAQGQQLPTAPRQPVIVRAEANRPQPLLDLMAGEPARARGMPASVVHEDLTRKFLVVSASSGVTDTLVTILARPREEKEIDSFVADLRRKHLDLLPKSREGATGSGGAIDGLATKLERLLYGVAYTEEITPRTRDFVLSFGERLAAQVVAANLCLFGIYAVPPEADAIGLITDDTYGNATALLDETRARLAPFLRHEAQAGRVSVITGFFGLSREGKTATFGRGGSDYSAAVVAH